MPNDNDNDNDIATVPEGIEPGVALPASKTPIAPVMADVDVRAYMEEQAAENRRLRDRLAALDRKLAGVAAAGNAETTRTCNACGAPVPEGKCPLHPRETVNVTLVGKVNTGGETFGAGTIVRRE